VGPHADAVGGAGLFGAGGLGNLLGAGGGGGGGGEQDQGLEQRALLGGGGGAGPRGQGLPGLPPARVDVAHREDDELLASGGLGGRGDRRVGDNHERQFAPILAGAEGAEPDEGRFLRQTLAEVEDVGVPRRGLVVARLGDGAGRFGAG